MPDKFVKIELYDGFPQKSPHLQDEVKDLQKLLVTAGYKTQVDGYYGKGTRDLVISFQKQKGLKPDGIVSKDTWLALAKETKPATTGTSSAASLNTFYTTYPQKFKVFEDELAELRKYWAIIQKYAKQSGVPPQVLAGIGSRESRWGLALKPKGAGGTGDYGNGHGLLQVDIRYHKKHIESLDWMNPEKHIRYAIMEVFVPYRNYIQRETGLSGRNLLRATVAAYNGGAGAVIRLLKKEDTSDVDEVTTKGDYSKDVFNRAGWFQLHNIK